MRSDGFGDVSDREQKRASKSGSPRDRAASDEEQSTTLLDTAHLRFAPRRSASVGVATSERVGALVTRGGERLDELGDALRAGLNQSAYRDLEQMDEVAPEKASHVRSQRLDELGDVLRGGTNRDRQESDRRLDELGDALRDSQTSAARLDELGAAMRAVTGLGPARRAGPPSSALQKLGVSLSAAADDRRIPQPPHPIGANGRRAGSDPRIPRPTGLSSPSSSRGNLKSASDRTTTSPGIGATTARDTGRISYTPSYSTPSALPAGVTSAIAPSAPVSHLTPVPTRGGAAAARAALPSASDAAGRSARAPRRGDESREFVRERRDTPITDVELQAALRSVAVPPVRVPSRPPPLPSARIEAPASRREPTGAFRADSSAPASRREPTGAFRADSTGNVPPIRVPSRPPALPSKRNLVPLSAAAAIDEITVPPALGGDEGTPVAPIGPGASAYVQADSWTLEAELVETSDAGEVVRVTRVSSVASVFATVRSLRPDWDISIWRESLQRVRAFVADQLPRTTKRRVWLVAGIIAVGLSAACTAAFLLRRTPEANAAVETGPTDAELQRIMIARTGFMVSSYPSGARIYVDGRETGRFTPERVSGLTPGLHSIELKLAGYLDSTFPAVLEEGATLVLPPVDLRPRPVTETETPEP